MDLIVFYVLAGIAIVASIGVVAQRNPMHSVLLHILLDAPFTAVTQIIIYAGAIMVLFLFVVMLLNAHTEDDVMPRLGPHAMKIGALLSVVLCVEVMMALYKLGLASFNTDAAVRSQVSNVGQIGTVLFTTYAFAFEVTSVLILVAMVGAVVIAGKARRES
jgi:NADH-quinone oxidoreductase subunit J